MILKVEDIEKYYGNSNNLVKALNGISFSVEKGEFIGIMGASGSGKTTLLNCISTIDRVTSGHIWIDEKDITTLKEKEVAKFRREQLGFIFQDFNLLDTLTAYENIALGLTILKTDIKKMEQTICKIVKKLGIESVLSQYPYQLSGGQKQRVACARALVTDPALILADEPTGALDSKSARMLLNCFLTMNQEFHSTIVMVTHDPFTASFCKRILFIKDGKIFNELIREKEDRKTLFNQIIEVVTLLGGDSTNVY